MLPSSVNVHFQTTATLPSTSTTRWDQSFANEQKLIQTVVSSLSIFGSLTIILTYFIFQDLQSTTRKFLVYISIGDFFTVYPYLIKPWMDDSLLNCKVQSFVTTTAVMWSFFWTSSLAIYLYVVIVRKKQESANKLMPYFHVINWGLPLVLVGLAWSENMLGSGNAQETGGWCWITYKSERKVKIWWMLVCGKFWEILSYFIDVILCFLVTREINAEVEDFRQSLSLETTQAAILGKKKLIWAPCLFVLLRIWGTIRFLKFCFYPDSDENLINKILIVCHIIGDSSQGFVYFILFCLCTAKFRENIGRVLCRCSRKKRLTIQQQGRPGSCQEHKYLLQNPKSTVFYT